MNKYVVVYGALADGFVFVGPFDTLDEACEYAEKDGADWSIVELNVPEDL